MRKETFMLRVESKDMQSRLIQEFNDCIQFAANSKSHPRRPSLDASNLLAFARS